MSFQLPNTTPVPNEIINGWARKLKGSELKVLLLVTRKTLGFVIDFETGLRKEEDWLSYKQLQEFTGLSRDALPKAIDALVEYKLIEVRDKNGNKLDTPEKRMLAGKKRLSFYYRLNLNTLQKTSHYFNKPTVQKNDTVGNNEATVQKSTTVMPENLDSTVQKSWSNKNKRIQKQTLQNHYEKNGILQKLPLLKVDKEYKDYLIEEILKVTNHNDSRKFYEVVTSKIPEDKIRIALSEIKTDGADNPAKLFNWKIQRVALSMLI